MKEIGYIYLTTNLVNGKQYVGQHLADSFDEKYKGSGHALQLAFKKYGWNNFKCEIICWCATQEELNYREQCEIVFHSTFSPNGYNLRYGGGSRGRFREETRKKLSEANKGKHHTEESRKKMSEAQKGRKLSNETKEKMSKSHKGVKKPPRTLEHRKHLSESQKKRFENPEERKKNSESHKGKQHSEETRKKMSDAQKRRYKNKENRYKQSKKVLQYTKDGVLVQEWRSIADAENEFGTRGHISACCLKKPHHNTACGFVWRFAN